MTTQDKPKPAQRSVVAFTVRSCLLFFVMVGFLAVIASLIDTVTLRLSWLWLHRFSLIASVPNWPGALLAAIVFNYCARWRISLMELKNEDATSLTIAAVVNWLLIPIAALVVVAVFTLVASLLKLG